MARYIYILTAFFFIALSPLAYAQNVGDSDDVQSLGDILNPQQPGALTSKDMANAYFGNCMETETLAFDEKEKESLCACTAANMGELLSASEFSNLYRDNQVGKDARGKVIAYAYTKCMDYVVESKIYGDCMVSPIIKKIIQGRGAICKCTAKRYHNDLIKKHAHNHIMKALTYDPMTLNPLEHYFTTTNYLSEVKRYVGICRSELLYKKKI